MKKNSKLIIIPISAVDDILAVIYFNCIERNIIIVYLKTMCFEARFVKESINFLVLFR